MLDLAEDLDSGKPVLLEHHLAAIKSNNLKFWFKYIGLGDVEFVESITNIKLEALKVRLKVDPNQFVAMCIGLSLINSGYIKIDHEVKILNLIGIGEWLTRKGYESVEEFGLEIGLKREGVYRRARVNKIVFIATAIGLKIVE
jgi:hypothetical protein